jgi:tetratricopeptide (TPR) repeat protein
MSTTPDEPAADPLSCCEEARRLAEAGEIDRAGELFDGVLRLGDTPYRARAALGLAVVREDVGDVNGARDADWTAIQTRDREYAPRAACHLALSHERAGDVGKAREAWLIAVDFGNPFYLPPACLALGRLADDDGDHASARYWWERVIEAGDAEHAALAADFLGHRLLERGEASAARDVLAATLRLIDRESAPGTYARLAVLLGLAHLDQAIGAFGSALDGAAEPTGTPSAVELLARILPLRDRTAEAAEVWRRGLADQRISTAVRDRLRRGFGPAEEDGEPWWEPQVEQAIMDGRLPLLAGELFGALDHMYALAALRCAGRSPDGTGDDNPLRQIVRVPSDYGWGPALHDSFADRLREAMGDDAPGLPPDWPNE